MSACWHSGLAEDWSDVPDAPPTADVVVDDDLDVVDEDLAGGLVVRARGESTVWLRADDDDVVDLDRRR